MVKAPQFDREEWRKVTYEFVPLIQQDQTELVALGGAVQFTGATLRGWLCKTEQVIQSLSGAGLFT